MLCRIKSSKNSIFFVLFFFLFSCQPENQNINPAVKPNIIDCQILTSDGNILYPSKKYISEFQASQQIISFIFFTPVFIHKISVFQNNSTNFDYVKTVKVYSNTGFIGQFNPENIIIDQIVGFIILKFDNAENILISDAYFKNRKYSLAFEKYNKKLAIDSIKFFSNDSTKLKLNVERIATKNNTNKFYGKFLDFSDFSKSATFNKQGYFFGFSEGNRTDTIYFGNLTSKKLTKFIFSKNFYDKQTLSLDIKFNKNQLQINTLPVIYTDFDDNWLVDIKTLDTKIVEDIRYATTNNFTKQKIYPCAYCLMRYKAAKDFIAAANEFEQKGFFVKVFDCYRPHSAQYKLWEIMPNKNFVAPPDKGSIHNRGAAVDMTLVDKNGIQLDMGTTYDYFGYKAFSINEDLPDTVLNNRNFMWSIMNKHGFRQIKTEWWHLSHYSCMSFDIEDTEFPCK